MSRARLGLVCLLTAIGAIMPVYILLGHGGPGEDHRIIWEAARLADPYQLIFPYPPIALPLLWPLRPLSLHASFWLFNLATCAAFAFAAKPFTRYWPIAALTPGALVCFSYGQTGFLVGAFWLLAFNRFSPAVGLLAFKPHLGFLSMLTLRSRRSWMAASATVALLSILPTIAYGSSIWLKWFERAHDFAGVAATWDQWDYISVSPAVQWGFWPWLAMASIAALLLVRRADVFTCATATLIISPYGFIYDTPAASLGIVLALIDERNPLKVAILAIALLAPSMIMFSAEWAPAAFLAALWVQVTSQKRKGEVRAVTE